MKILLAASLVLAQATAFAQECQDCPCDLATPRAVLYDDYGNTVLVTSRMPGVDPGDYTIDFPALDTNGDGQLSRNEVLASQELSRGSHNLALEFEVADRNGDGRLSPTELSQWHSSGSAGGW